MATNDRAEALADQVEDLRAELARAERERDEARTALELVNALDMRDAILAMGVSEFAAYNAAMKYVEKALGREADE